MSTEANKALLRRWWEALEQGNALEVIEEFYAPDNVLHDPSQPEPVRGIEGVRAFITEVVTGFPDGHYRLDDLLADGDKVAQRLTVRGTHQGEFQHIPATGKAVEIWVMVISRIANNKIVEEWQMADTLGMLQQLGVIPPPEQSGAEGGGLSD